MSPQPFLSETRQKSPSRRWSGRCASGVQGADYEALALAGCGTCCEVWQVRERASGRLLAIKQLRPEWEDQRVARRLLENEAEVGARVSSPFVVRVHDAQLATPPRFVVLEWLSGQSLEQLLAAQQRLPCSQALWIARQCAQAMHDLLDAGFTHGDIKPANLFVCGDGAVKLIDLGFAQADRRNAGAAAGECRDVLTGTPDYLAPESLVPATSPGIAKDIYSLGITLYRLLTGRLPFQGETADVLRQQQQAPAPSVRAVVPHVPREVGELVCRLMSKQPLRRSQGLPGLVRELVSLELESLQSELAASE